MYRFRKNIVFGIMFLVVCVILFQKMLKEMKQLSTKTNRVEKMHNKALRVKSPNANIFVHPEGGIAIPDDDVLRELDFAELQELYHRYTESIQIRCNRQVHLGNELDGGYHVCEDKDVVPIKPCLIYSFGIARDFSFDDAVSDMFGCKVHSFDFSNSMPDHQHSPNVTFHSLGIGSDNNNKKIKTLGTIRKQLGHESVRLDLLKLDVESAEWAALEEMLNDGSINDVKQLIVEFHIFLIGRKIDLTDKDSYRSHLIILRRLYQAGFRIFYFRMWNHLKQLIFESPTGVSRTSCHEVHFLRVL